MCKIGFHEKTNGSFILEKNKLTIRKYMQFKAQNMRCSRQSLGEMVIWTWPLEGGSTSNDNHQTKRFVFKIPKSVWHGAHPQVIFTLVYHWHPLTIIAFFARKYSHHLAINRGQFRPWRGHSAPGALGPPTCSMLSAGHLRCLGDSPSARCTSIVDWKNAYRCYWKYSRCMLYRGISVNISVVGWH